jgi:hypothetical protein
MLIKKSKMFTIGSIYCTEILTYFVIFVRLQDRKSNYNTIYVR